MISEQDLLDAIEQCQGEKNPNANTCMKLAAYYTILDFMRKDSPGYSFKVEPTARMVYDSGTEFSEAIMGKDAHTILGVIDELMDTIQVLSPRLYAATISKLKT